MSGSGVAPAPAPRKPNPGIKRKKKPKPISETPRIATAAPAPSKPSTSIAGDVGKLVVGGQEYGCGEGEFEMMSELGAGSFGTVKKVRHKKADVLMAVKEMRDSMDQREREKLAEDIHIVRNARECPQIIDYYGVNCREGLVMIYMEVMVASLDSCYEVLQAKEMPFPEDVLTYIAISMMHGLLFLKEKLGVMHRDIKPSNVLLGAEGEIKLTDFGMAKVMDQSLLHSHVGCERYLAPERLDPSISPNDYGTESDVWSYGVALVELGMLKFPYDYRKNHAFQLFTKIVRDPAPVLPSTYSEEFRSFVAACLNKNRGLRPRWARTAIEDEEVKALKDSPFYVANKAVDDRTKREWMVVNVVQDLVASRQ
jgi:serine/threonine protein kinase